MLYSNPFRPISDATAKTRTFGLDLLRTIAIALVLYGHCVLLFPESGRAILFKFLFMDPVTLFFVLSGFLIGRILLDAFELENFNFRSLFQFWFRRWMRTIPAYLVTLLLLVFVYKKYDIRFVLPFVFFVQNFNWPHPQWFPEAWSLSIEEWFYLSIPLLLFLISIPKKQSTSTKFLVTCLSVIILIPIYRWYKFENEPFTGRTAWDYLFRMQVLTRLDSIMYGVFGAYLYRFKPSQWLNYRVPCLLAGILLIVITYFYTQTYAGREAFYSSVFSLSVEPFSVLLVMPFFAGLMTAKGRMAKGITATSIISYSLYLMNMSFVSLYVCFVIPHFGLTEGWLLAYKVAVYWIVTFASAIVLYLVVEHPFMILRDWITKKDMREINK